MIVNEATAPPNFTNKQHNTGQVIFEAAVELFGTRGYNATSMRQIAAAVPLRAAGIYHWYTNKEAILLHLEHFVLDGLRTAVESAIKRQHNPASQLAAAVREHVMFHGLNPRASYVADSELRALSGDDRLEVQSMRDAYQEIFVKIINDGVRAGVFKTTDVRISSYAILLECTGVALWFNPSGSKSLNDVADIHVELVLGSLFTAPQVIALAILDSAPSTD